MVGGPVTGAAKYVEGLTQNGRLMDIVLVVQFHQEKLIVQTVFLQGVLVVEMSFEQPN